MVFAQQIFILLLALVVGNCAEARTIHRRDLRERHRTRGSVSAEPGMVGVVDGLTKLVEGKSCGRNQIIGAEDAQDTLNLCSGSCRSTNACGFISYSPQSRTCRRFKSCAENAWENLELQEENPSSYAVIWVTSSSWGESDNGAGRWYHNNDPSVGGGMGKAAAKELQPAGGAPVFFGVRKNSRLTQGGGDANRETRERAHHNGGGGTIGGAGSSLMMLVNGKACQDRDMIGYQEMRKSVDACAASCRSAPGCGFISFFPMLKSCRRYLACSEDSRASAPGGPAVATYRVTGGIVAHASSSGGRKASGNK